jgi:hypothetical protein
VLLLAVVSLIVGYGARPSAATDTLFARDRDLMDVATGFVFPSHDVKLWATLGYCKTSRSVVTIEANGKLKTLATLPSRPTSLKCAIDTIAYSAGGLYVTQGTNIYLVSFNGASVTPVETIPSVTCGTSVGILRDPFNLFDSDYLLVCDGPSGEVFRWNQTSDPAVVAAVGVPIAIGADVALPTFGALGRQLFVYAGATNQLFAVSPTGVTLVTTLPASLASGPGVVLVLHSKPYASITANAALFVVSTNGVRTFAPAVLVPAGDVLVATEGGQIVRVSPTPQGGVVVSSFHPNLLVRGGAFSPLAPVVINVAPGNPDTQGNKWVDIYSTPTFNAPAEVDQSSLTFGITGGEATLSFCEPNPKDRNHDGLDDLRCHFRFADGGFLPGIANQFGILRGRTQNPFEFEGGD